MTDPLDLTPLTHKDLLDRLRFTCFQMGMFEATSVGQAVRGYDGSYNLEQARTCGEQSEMFALEIERRLFRPFVLQERVLKAIDDTLKDPQYAVGNATFNEGVNAVRAAVITAMEKPW
jgi:hypothetical protein